MKVLYVRHGKTIANAHGLVSTAHTALSKTGLKDIRATGQELQRHHVAKIIASPYPRAQRTAEIIADELNFSHELIMTMPALRERHLGSLEGKLERHSPTYFYTNDSEYAFETHLQLIARSREALEEIREIVRNTDGTVVIVGHAISGYFLVEVAQGRVSFEEFGPIIGLRNAEFKEIEI